MSYILIVDNFYSDIDFVREQSLNSAYYPPRTSIIPAPSVRVIGNLDKIEYIDGWRGYRTSSPFSEYERHTSVIKEKICDYYNLSIEDYVLESYLHYSTVETKSTCFPSFEEYKFHRDSRSKYAGVIYLHPDPPQNTGTTIVDPQTNEHIHVDNVYNRLICYPSNILHAPTNLFGHDLETGRLTLTFFLYTKETYQEIEIERQDLFVPGRKKQNSENIPPQEVQQIRAEKSKSVKKFII